MADAEFLTTAQVLELLQIGRTKLWELIRTEGFPAYRIGGGRNGGLRYRRADVLQWMESRRVSFERRARVEESAAPPPGK